MSAFDETEEPPLAAAPPSESPPEHITDDYVDDDGDIASGMLEVASAPALLMLDSDDELPLVSEAVTDLSLNRHDSSRPSSLASDDKPTQQQQHLDNALYFYQG